MKTKITMKDIAREAGVSVATVSYVLNNRTEERISEETRKKVLQIVNLLNYTPNQSAKALATSRTGNVAVYLPDVQSPLKAAELLHFLNAMAAVLGRAGYRLIHLAPGEQGQVDSVDAILCYDVSARDFYNIGDHNFVPLLAVDSQIGDPLFFQVSSDYDRLSLEAGVFFGGREYTAAVLDVGNDARREALEAAFPSVTPVGSAADLAALSGKPVAVFEKTLYDLLSGTCRLCYLPSITEEKLQRVIECMELAVNRVQITEHNILI